MKSWGVIVVIFFVLMVFSVKTEGSISFESAGVEDTIRVAIRCIYKLEYEKSYRLFKSVFYSHPFAPFGTIAVEWLLDQQKSSVEEANQNLEKSVFTVSSYYRRLVKNHPDDYRILFYYGLTMGLKARVLLGKKDWIGVLVSGYKSYSYIKKAWEKEADYDACFPMGLFSYYVGVSSAYMKVATALLGISGSKEEGLKQIEITAYRGNYGKYEARSTLAFIYLFMEGNYREALRYSSTMAKEFPNNPYFKYLMAESYMGMGECDKVKLLIREMEEVFPALEGRVKRETAFRINLLRASLALYGGRLQEADKFFKECLNYTDFELDYELGSLYLRIGYMYDMMGEREKAKKWYRKVMKLDNRSVACREAARRYKEPFSLGTSRGFVR